MGWIRLGAYEGGLVILQRSKSIPLGIYISSRGSQSYAVVSRIRMHY